MSKPETTTGPVFKIAKLHTAVRVPGVTQQSPLTLDKNFSSSFTLEIVGELLRIEVTKDGKKGIVYTPLSNVVCLSEA